MISIDTYLDRYIREKKLPPERPQPGLSDLCQVMLRPAAQCPLRDDETFGVISAYFDALYKLDRFADFLAREMFRNTNPIFHKQCRDRFDIRKRECAGKCRAAWSNWNNPSGKSH